MRSLLFLPFILLFGIGCNQKTATTTSGSVNAEAPFLWEGPGFPKDVKISTDLTAETAKINAMATAWDTAMNNQIHFFNFTGTTAEKTNTITNTNQLRDNLFGIYKATNWPYPDYPDALAITQIFAVRYNRGDANEYVAIQEADILINYENFDFDDPDPTAWDYDFQTVLLHEMGHFLGLQHKPKSYPRTNSVMYPSIYTTEIKQAPLTIDKQDLAAKYNITLPLTAGGSGIANPNKVDYSPNGTDLGTPEKMILELRANGDCVHYINGEIVSRHR